MSFEEDLAYFQAAGQPLQDIARLILETRMRPEEVYRLAFSNLNFDRRTIIQMTLRYVHFYEEHKREAAAKVEKFKVAEMEKVGEKVRAPLQFSLQ